MAIEEEEVVQDEDGDIVGYKGEWKTVGLAVIFGLLIGAVIATLSTAETELGDPYLQNPNQFCATQGYDNGYYTSGLLGPLKTTAGIRCFNSTGNILNDTFETTAAARFYLKNDYTIVNKSIQNTAGENSE